MIWHYNRIKVYHSVVLNWKKIVSPLTQYEDSILDWLKRLFYLYYLHVYLYIFLEQKYKFLSTFVYPLKVTPNKIKMRSFISVSWRKVSHDLPLDVFIIYRAIHSRKKKIYVSQVHLKVLWSGVLFTVFALWLCPLKFPFDNSYLRHIAVQLSWLHSNIN